MEEFLIEKIKLTTEYVLVSMVRLHVVLEFLLNDFTGVKFMCSTILIQVH